MKTIKNEKGYALLMVMMLIILFTVLGMGLMATNMNSAKQFTMKEDQVQARHQAEMGLLHYQAEVIKKVSEYKFTRSTGEKQVAALARSRVELCQQVYSIELPNMVGNNGKYKISDRIINGCSPSTTGEIIISLSSTGESEKGLEKIVDGSIELSPPKMDITDEDVPVKPEKPENNDSEDENEGYTEMTGPFKMSKNELEFDTLIINKSLTEVNSSKKNEGQTLQFEPGNGEYLATKKDLYVGGTIHSQNHACIYVRGDMTVLGDMYLGTQSIIIVYGNAYFKGDVDLKNKNAQIFVAGNAYKGNNQIPTDEYKNFDGFNSKCMELTNWPNPETYQPDKSQYSWDTDDELNPYYR